MMSSVLAKHFERMGARVRVQVPAKNSWVRSDARVGLDIGRDALGEFFDFTIGADAKASLEVLQVAAKDRHLLLLVKQADESGKQQKSRFLCGHDERHWFVAAVPEESPVSTVEAAKTALKPEEVRRQEVRVGLSVTKKHTRANEAFKRQGEWFFVPAWSLRPAKHLILKNEPFNRGRGKFHYAQEAYRKGGTVAYVGDGKVLNQQQYDALMPRERSQTIWQRMMEGADMYVRGKISHEDHATLVLDGWHKVLMNLEHRARAMQSVRFLD